MFYKKFMYAFNQSQRGFGRRCWTRTNSIRDKQPIQFEYLRLFSCEKIFGKFFCAWDPTHPSLYDTPRRWGKWFRSSPCPDCGLRVKVYGTVSYRPYVSFYRSRVPYLCGGVWCGVWWDILFR